MMMLFPNALVGRNDTAGSIVTGNRIPAGDQDSGGDYRIPAGDQNSGSDTRDWQETL